MSSYWQNKITNADKLYKEWETTYKCETLYRYYKGDQWRSKIGTLVANYQPYTINLFYSTIKIKMASLLFQRPSFIISPRPGNSDWDLDFAAKSAELKQDVLNTIVKNPNSNFVRQAKLAALDSFFWFGLMEVGYAADWRNPQKEAPLLSSHGDDDKDEEKAKVISDNEVPVNERFYFKRIPPKRFRVSVSDATELNDLEWCGYYEYFYTSHLKKTKGIKWPKDGPDTSYFSGNYSAELGRGDSEKPEFLKLLKDGSISKVWHIWDSIEHTRNLFLDGCFEDPLWQGDFERLPFQDLRWDSLLEGWYPMPPCFQWLSEQDEINEAREQTRSYRRRFTRKFQYIDGQVDQEEVDKFASGPDGVLIKTAVKDAITPIQNPEQGPTAERALLIAKDDFNTVSGTSAEARGQSTDRETATQAKIVDARAAVRESAEALDFSNWICLIGREVLCQAQEKLVDGLWVKYTSDPSEQILTEVKANQPIFKYIKAQDVSDGYDFDIDIDVMNATPQAMEQAKQSFISFITIVQQFPAIAMSPVLIREAAMRVGYRNEKVINQMQQAAILAMAAKASAVANSKGQTLGEATGQNPQSTQNAQMATPELGQIQQQITQQLQ